MISKEQHEKLKQLVDSWRLQGCSDGDGFDGPDYDRGVNETLLNCADDLVEILSPRTKDH